MDADSLTEDDAARAGVRSLAELLRLLDRRDGAHVYRMRVGPAGADPRVALREQAELSATSGGRVDVRLDRWTPPAPDGPWTRQVLRLIADHPASARPTSPPRSGGRRCRSSGTSASSRSWG